MHATEGMTSETFDEPEPQHGTSTSTETPGALADSSIEGQLESNPTPEVRGIYSSPRSQH